MTAILETEGLGKRYGATWALRDCTLRLPADRVVALVGPNGAGKTTLLHLAVGLLTPSAGDIRVFGRQPARSPRAVLPRIGFVAQDHPLYRTFTVGEMLEMGRRLNPRWDNALAVARLRELHIPLARPVGKLSGGQQAQVALALALAKRPDLLLLDEPVASLDPLARRDFLRALLAGVADQGLTILLSSHILADLERACDYLIILTAAQVQLADDIETIRREHKRLVGPRQDVAALARLHQIIEISHTDRQTTVLARVDGAVFDPAWEVRDVSLEDIVLAYLSRAAGPAPEADPAPPAQKVEAH